jgi:predicted dehydrogenase
MHNGEVSGYFDPGIDFIQNNVNRFGSLEELIDSKPDYCVIAAPTVFHEEIALELITNKVRVLIEKPVAHSYEAAQTIYKASVDNDVTCGIGHIERFNSAVIEAKNRISQGELGEIYQISTSRQGPFPSRISDVGVVKDLATHDIDLTTWLSDSTYASVSAQSVHRSGRIHEDMISIVGKLNNGVVVNHNVNWLSPRKQREVIVIGEKGLFQIDLLGAELYFHANGEHRNLYTEVAHFNGVSQGDVVKYSFDRIEPLLTEHQQFIATIEGTPSTSVSLSAGVEILRVADAIIRSASSQKTVTL